MIVPEMPQWLPKSGPPAAALPTNRGSRLRSSFETLF
jgi:hypothetical protein